MYTFPVDNKQVVARVNSRRTPTLCCAESSFLFRSGSRLAMVSVMSGIKGSSIALDGFKCLHCIAACIISDMMRTAK